MDYETARSTLAGRMQSNWTLTKVQYPNLEFEPVQNQPYVSFNILLGAQEQIAFGGTNGNLYRQVGLIALQVFIPENSGTKTLNAILAAFKTLWRGQSLSGIVVRAPVVTQPGKTGNGWFQVNVNVPFHWDEIL